MTNNPFKSFDDDSLVNLYGMLYSQNLENKEWFKSHNPLQGQVEMHDVNTWNYVQCMRAIEERLDTDLVKKLKDANDYKGAHKVMTDWIDSIEQRLTRQVVELDYCHAFGWVKDREVSCLLSHQLIRKVKGSEVMTVQEYRDSLATVAKFGGEA
jgi:hypothetical protein